MNTITAPQTSRDVITLPTPPGSTVPPAKKTFAKRIPHAVLFGDSLTERSHGGWSSHLAALYSRRLDIIVRGFGGYNSRDAVQALPAILEPYYKQSVVPAELALFVIFFGANDSALPVSQLGTPHSARQHVSLQDYESNVSAIVSQVRKVAPKASILLITPPPVHEPTRVMRLVERIGQAAVDQLPAGTLDRRNEFTKKYADACRALGQALNVPVLDLWTGLQHDENGKPLPEGSWGPIYLDDGLHLTLAGEKRVGKLVEKALISNFAELDPVKMQPLLPHWEDVTGMPDWGKLFEP